jgi:DNA-binding beta-propeller fold protein YncE
MDIESFSQIYFDSDENYVYVMVTAWGKNSIIKKFDKKTMSLSAETIAIGSEGYGMAVDANYIYIGNKDNNKIEIYNKHTGNLQGDFNIKSPSLIDCHKGYLYAFSKDNNSVNKYGITFN